MLSIILLLLICELNGAREVIILVSEVRAAMFGVWDQIRHLGGRILLVLANDPLKLIVMSLGCSRSFLKILRFLEFCICRCSLQHHWHFVDSLDDLILLSELGTVVREVPVFLHIIKCGY